MEARILGILRRVVGRVALAKHSCAEIPCMQGPGTFRMMLWRCQALPTIGHSRRKRRAAGLNALAPCIHRMRWRTVRIVMRWRYSVAGCLANGRHSTAERLAESSPKTACLGNGRQGARRLGRSRGQKQEEPGQPIVLIALSSGRHRPEATLYSRRATTASLPAERHLTSQSRKNTLRPCGATRDACWCDGCCIQLLEAEYAVWQGSNSCPCRLNGLVRIACCTPES